MGVLSSVWRHMKTWFIFSFIWGYQFVVSSLLLVILMMLAYIFIWPFNRLLYRRITLTLAYMSWCQVTWLVGWWSGSEIRLFLDDVETMKVVGKEHNLMLSNHKYEVDWCLVWLIAERLGLLPGGKIFGKEMLKYLPIIGWIWVLTDSIFLKRQWEKDRQTITRDLQFISDYPKEYPITLMLYAEGTRFTEQKHVESMAFARSRGMPELKHHLLPRTKGFTLTMHGIHDKVPAIYDITVGFLPDSAPPTLSSLIQGRPLKGQIYGRRIPTKNVPLETDEACSEWLHQLYREKDAVYENFHQNGRFTIGHEVKIPMRYRDLAVTMFWFVLLVVPLLIYMFHVFVTGSWLLKLCMAILVFTVSQVMNILITATKIKSGSEYGTDRNANSEKTE